MSNRRKANDALTCGHCGNTTRMLLVGGMSDCEEIVDEGVPPYEAGTCFELQECPSCKKLNLASGPWHDGMDEPDDWTPSIVLPAAHSKEAFALFEQQQLDLRCMRQAVDAARRCKPEGDSPKPKVAAVVVGSDGNPVVAHRGEFNPGEHAEYTLLEGKCRSETLAGATVYTTLEPCTTRSHPKIPCVQRLIDRKVDRVVVGMLDPDERIRGLGVLALRKANIRVDLFPFDLMRELEEMNREFISSREREARPATAVSVGADKEAGQAAVEPLSNQPTPLLTCLEFLRVENINAPWIEENRLHLARVMVDGSGARLGWNAVEVTRDSFAGLKRVLFEFAQESPSIQRASGLSQHLLALVACGGSVADNAQLAKDIMAECDRGPKLGIRVLVGFMANNRFVDEVLTDA